MILDPLDNRLIKKIKRSERSSANTSLTNQPILGDGYSLNPTDYTFNSTNVIQTTASEILRFTKGDKIFLRQNSIDKAFYIVNVNIFQNRLTVSAGNVYSFTNHAVESISLSLRGVGFPVGFAYTPVWTHDGNPINTITNSYPLGNPIFYVEGNTCRIVGQSMNFNTNSPATNPTEWYISLPFTPTNTTTQFFYHLNRGAITDEFNIINPFIRADVDILNQRIECSFNFDFSFTVKPATNQIMNLDVSYIY